MNNNIDVPYNCITLYQANTDKFIKATDQEKMLSENHEKSLRAPQKTNKRKKNIFQHVKEVYDETLEETKKEAQVDKDNWGLFFQFKFRILLCFYIAKNIAEKSLH